MQRGRILLITGLMLAIVTLLMFGYILLNDTTELKNDVNQVEWVEINSPPNVNGPCYAYFSHNFLSYYGYSGVWCK